MTSRLSNIANSLSVVHDPRAPLSTTAWIPNTEHEPAQLAAPWPSYKTFLAIDKTKILNFGRRIMVALALGRSMRWRSTVDGTISRCPWARPALAKYPILFRPLLSGFLDARSSVRRRFEHYSHDLEFTSARLHAAFPNFFPVNLSAILWSDRADKYMVVVSLNRTDPQEGLWRLSLQNVEGERLFSLCFSVLPAATMFVGSVQGGRSNGSTDMTCLIRTATKHFEGLRPHFLLFDVLRTVAKIWRIRRILGASNRHQLSARRGRRDRTVHFSYDAYFIELGARSTHDDEWDVPLRREKADMNSVPTRKRAMYRRRFSVLRRLQDDIRSRLSLDLLLNDDAARTLIGI
jgi:uncharacterized protein VirK/YbjX